MSKTYFDHIPDELVYLIMIRLEDKTNFVELNKRIKKVFLGVYNKIKLGNIDPVQIFKYDFMGGLDELYKLIFGYTNYTHKNNNFGIIEEVTYFNSFNINNNKIESNVAEIFQERSETGETNINNENLDSLLLLDVELKHLLENSYIYANDCVKNISHIFLYNKENRFGDNMYGTISIIAKCFNIYIYAIVKKYQTSGEVIIYTNSTWKGLWNNIIKHTPDANILLKNNKFK